MDDCNACSKAYGWFRILLIVMEKGKKSVVTKNKREGKEEGKGKKNDGLFISWKRDILSLSVLTHDPITLSS